MKTAFITGVSGVIGCSLAKAFLSQGYTVLGQYNTGKQRIADFVSELEKQNLSRNFFAYRCDFSVNGNAQKLCDLIKKDFPRIDVLICNAGTDVYKLITETSEEEWESVFNVNVKTAFVLSKNFVPAMQSFGFGRVIYISSIWGVKAGCMEGAYSASKFALNGLCKALAQEVGANGVTVNCICPGMVDTPMNANFSEREKADIVMNIPLNRMCSPNEISDLAIFLCGDNAGYITGENIVIDGGFTL